MNTKTGPRLHVTAANGNHSLGHTDFIGKTIATEDEFTKHTQK